LHPDKGVHVAVDAVGRLHAAGLPVRLTVAGHGPGDYPDSLRARAAACDAPADFVGRLPHEALPALYRDHDAFVFPSIWREPFGLTHLEAMASGTPVVSTADGGQGEFLEHGSNALVVPKADPAALADALALLARDGDLRRRLAATAREMVARRFSVDRYVDDLAALLATVAGGTP
jgi:glycosyltransferase involved in cell wall biosynthesis